MKILGLMTQHFNFYGWVIVAACTTAAYSAVVFYNPILGVFVNIFQDEFQWKMSEIALAITIGSIGAAILAPITGIALDKWGGRWVIAGSSIIMFFCLIFLASLNHLWQLYVFYAIGRSLTFGMTSGAYIAVNNWFIKKRGLTVGIVAAGTRVAMGTIPILLALIIGISGSWRIGWYSLAVLVVFLGIVPSLLFIRKRPEDMGLLPDGLDSNDQSENHNEEFSLEMDFSVKQALRTRAFWFIGLGVGLGLFGQGSVNFLQIPHLIDRGLSLTQSTVVVSVFSITASVGGIFAGVLSSKIRMRWVQAFSMLGMSFGILLLINANSFLDGIIYGLVYGTFFGSNFTMLQSIYADYFGRREIGAIQGWSRPVQLSMNALGPFLGGLWYDQTSSFTDPFTLYSILFIVAAISFGLARYPKR
ncbi:MAG: MFS transporter [Dehalococcoidia bacterium]|tara:strand:+ start:1833 stop:3083 length:1251 start_codon:yes stop_codon:yes gene_type:complete